MSRVYVGLSGGVDSAVAAALLRDAGHEVTGVFIKIWQPEFLECSWREDRLDAMRVAATLGVPFKEIDLSDEYKREVIEEMLADYARGVTPNPDVVCNRSIKFGAFARWAIENGAERVATGHHARVVKSEDDYALVRGRDQEKDQSYFLARLGQDDLARTEFPAGEYEKREIRALARRYGLPVADKPDSQGLCFVGNVDMREFLGRYLEAREGAVLDTEGREIGRHEGAIFYTKGQRHGFTVHDAHAPHFVVSIDVEKNTLTVAREREATASKSATLELVHWIRRMPKLPATFDVQVRYREAPRTAHVHAEKAGHRVEFDRPTIAASGQLLAAYDGEECVGSAFIR
jgi:tRNA-specific 2-thiouridylase